MQQQGLFIDLKNWSVIWLYWRMSDFLSAISLPAGRQGRHCGESKQFYALINN
jgi:hypothetical protein